MIKGYADRMMRAAATRTGLQGGARAAKIEAIRADMQASANNAYKGAQRKRRG